MPGAQQSTPPERVREDAPGGDASPKYYFGPYYKPPNKQHFWIDGVTKEPVYAVLENARVLHPTQNPDGPQFYGPLYKIPEGFPYYYSATDSRTAWDLSAGAKLLPASAMPDQLAGCILPVALQYLANIGWSMWENMVTKQTFL